MGNQALAELTASNSNLDTEASRSRALRKGSRGGPLKENPEETKEEES